MLNSRVELLVLVGGTDDERLGVGAQRVAVSVAWTWILGDVSLWFAWFVSGMDGGGSKGGIYKGSSSKIGVSRRWLMVFRSAAGSSFSMAFGSLTLGLLLALQRL